jgi:hypothetical protein
LETAAKLLKLLERVLATFSKCALKSLDNQTDFDSAIRRFESSPNASKKGAAGEPSTRAPLFGGCRAVFPHLSDRHHLRHDPLSEREAIDDETAVLRVRRLVSAADRRRVLAAIGIDRNDQ